MKTDIEKIEKITAEMTLNDIAYIIMQEELDWLKEDIDCGNYEDFGEEMCRAYFFQRVLSVLSNEDIPTKAIIGLLSSDSVLSELYDNRYKYIGESDAEADIYKYVMEYGYRMYDGIANPGDTPEEVFIMLAKKYIMKFSKGACEDDDE